MNSVLNWSLFTVLILLSIVLLSVWWYYRPQLNRYLAKSRNQNRINRQYNIVCKSRSDFVYHYFWAIDSGEFKAAEQSENLVLQADIELEKLRLQFQALNEE